MIKLAAGDPCPLEEITIEEASFSDEEILELKDVKQEEYVDSSTVESIIAQPVVQERNEQEADCQKNVLLESLVNTEIQGKYERSIDFAFLENIAEMLERNNRVLSEYSKIQDNLKKDIGQCFKASK